MRAPSKKGGVMSTETKKGRGRPKGSKNKPKVDQPAETVTTETK